MNQRPSQALPGSADALASTGFWGSLALTLWLVAVDLLVLVVLTGGDADGAGLAFGVGALSLGGFLAMLVGSGGVIPCLMAFSTSGCSNSGRVH